MASISAVTFNSGSTIDGTLQVGQLAIGSTPQDYSNGPGGLRWWSSADLDSGYIIAHVNANANQPNQEGVPGVKVGFWRTQFTDSDFISWAEYIAKRYHTPQTFSTATEANIWLFANGYWTSYSNEPIPTITLTPTSTSTPTPTPTPSTTPSDEFLADPIITENDEYIDLGDDEYLMFVDPSGPVVTPSSTPEVTTTPTASVTTTPSVTPTITPTSSEVSVTPTPSVTETPTITPTSSEIPVTPTPTPSATPTSGPAPSGFTVNIYESGSDVVMSVSGSLNINDLTQVASGAGLGNEGLIVPVSPTFIMSPITPPFGQFDAYSGFTSGPTDLGSGGFSPASSFSGNVFGIVKDSGGFQLFVPVGYETSDPISSTQTFTSQSFTSLGLVEGTYTYTWGSGANAELVNVVVGGTPPPPPPSSGFTVTIQEIGSDVVWSGSGSLDLSNLTLENNSTLSAGYDPSLAIWGAGPTTSTNTDLYGGASFTTYPISFGTPPGSPATSGVGNIFGILPGGTGRVVVVPENYISGSSLSGSTTYENTTISGMNLTTGTYIWSWGSGEGETITLIIG